MATKQKPVKRPPGRVTVRTTETDQIILKALRLGLSGRMAADLAGVGETSFRRWKDEDEEFAAQCNIARAEMAHQYVGFINRAARQDWRAAAWLLPRHFPEFQERNAAQDSVEKMMEFWSGMINEPTQHMEANPPGGNGKIPGNGKAAKVTGDLAGNRIQST